MPLPGSGVEMVAARAIYSATCCTHSKNCGRSSGFRRHAFAPIRTAIAHPEDPGPFACPPLAALVTAGGRLLLAMVHRLVADRGGIVAACDTDGAHIVARPGPTV